MLTTVEYLVVYPIDIIQRCTLISYQGMKKELITYMHVISFSRNGEGTGGGREEGDEGGPDEGGGGSQAGEMESGEDGGGQRQ